MKAEELAKLSINQLESISFQLTEERQALHQQALLVQKALSNRIEAERIAKMLGKPVQIIKASGIDDELHG